MIQVLYTWTDHLKKTRWLGYAIVVKILSAKKKTILKKTSAKHFILITFGHKRYLFKITYDSNDDLFAITYTYKRMI